MGDCGFVLEDLVRLWRSRRSRAADTCGPRRSGGSRSPAGGKPQLARLRPVRRTTIKPQHAIRRLHELTKGRDTYITTEVGQHQMWAAQHYGFEQPNRWMTSGGLGTMGYGLPAAVGVQMAHPKALVIDIAGEASVLMNMQEMSTALQYRLPDQGVHPEQQLHGHGAPVAGVAPRLAAIRKAIPRRCLTSSSSPRPMAASASAATIPQTLTRRSCKMIDTPRPVIFDCVVEREAENCFPMIPSGKAHNEMLLPPGLDDWGTPDLGAVIDEKGKMLV